MRHLYFLLQLRSAQLLASASALLGNAGVLLDIKLGFVTAEKETDTGSTARAAASKKKALSPPNSHHPKEGCACLGEGWLHRRSCSSGSALIPSPWSSLRGEGLILSRAVRVTVLLA